MTGEEVVLMVLKKQNWVEGMIVRSNKNNSKEAAI